jgi:hypothetical protein
MPGNAGEIERARNDIKQTLERLRGTIRMKVLPRDQSELLDVAERVQESIAIWDVSGIGSYLLRGKDTARRVLRGKAGDMVMILNEMETIETLVNKLIPLMSKHKH